MRRHALSGFAGRENSADSLDFPPESLGQRYPHHYSQSPDDTLGEPLSIREVARVIGCSDWTVRHRYLPKGLPHLRSGPSGKLLFYRKQVVAWILQQQKKGGR
jgi:hypothetical protein